ncbi:MAG: class I SAM-dependent methyltransferase [Thermodesulfobacteriota bacterium]
MVENNWREEAVIFDKYYSQENLVSRIPFLGRYINNKLLDRLNRSLLFLQRSKCQKVIDLGCGTGRFALEAARLGARVYAYDISGQALSMARQNAAYFDLQQKCSFFHANISEVDFPDADGWFDLGTLQYLMNPEIVIGKLSHVKHFFSCLPCQGHWLDPLRRAYRHLLKHNPYKTYSESDIHNLFKGHLPINIEKDGMAYYVTSLYE